jgi:hypothetical protein
MLRQQQTKLFQERGAELIVTIESEDLHNWRVKETLVRRQGYPDGYLNGTGSWYESTYSAFAEGRQTALDAMKMTGP